MNRNIKQKVPPAFDKKPSISYWSKTKVMCPVCQKAFMREEMLSGGGRMIAGSLTEELRERAPSASFRFCGTTLRK